MKGKCFANLPLVNIVPPSLCSCAVGHKLVITNAITSESHALLTRMWYLWQYLKLKEKAKYSTDAFAE